ncbi:exocyst complex component Sec3-domain-containing protein [Gorgonomyces haynaldii]|nr:exocyst complex component Sec3-domain-containing protein [Gorgonomyces haynaldii]
MALFSTVDVDALLYKATIIDANEPVKITKDQFKQVKDDDDDDDKRIKLRVVGIDSKKSKSRIVRLKPKRGVTKQWPIDDVTSISLGDSNLCILNISKQYYWYFETLEQRTEFLDHLLKCYQKQGKPLPILVGFDEELIAEQVKAFRLAPKPLEADKKEAPVSQLLLTPFEEEQIAQKTVEELPQIDLDLMLNDFNWQASGDAAALEERLITELQALEAANVHDIIQSEERANAIVEQIEKSLQDLGTIEQWLLKYTKLLQAMGQDVHQIEAQNKGMQVVTNNQKQLLLEIETLLQSLRVPSFIVEILQNEPLDIADGIKECERAVDRVMDILHLKLDSLQDMQAVKERLGVAQEHCNQFASRFHQHLTQFFSQQADLYLQDKLRASQRGALKLYAHEQLENKLFKFKKLMNWLKENDTRKHYDLQMSYVSEMGRCYNREISEFLEVLKNNHIAKKSQQEENDFLFVNQQVSVSSAATNALKSAIRTQATERLGIKQKLESLKIGKRKEEEITPRQRQGSIGSVDSQQEDKMSPDEALGHALLKLASIMVREQNFMMDFFRIVKKQEESPLEPEPEDIGSVDSLRKWQDALIQPHHMFKDPKAEKRIHELLTILFSLDTLKDTLSNLIDLGLKYDQSNAVGMMVHIEFYLRDYQNTCHVFVVNLYEQLHKQAQQAFDKFVSDQIKAIEETKVTTKKRTGVLQAFKTFPKFVDRMERMLSNWDGNARKTVDKAYASLIRCMFDALNTLAQQAGQDDEKDSLNVHILTVENTHHFFSELRARKVSSLEESVKQAKLMYDVNLESYCNVVIRKPLGKLVDFFDGVESLLKTQLAHEISFHVQYSKNSLRDLIKKYPGREIKKALEVIYKRVDKHYSEEEGLLQVVWRGIQEEFTRMLRRYEELIAKCYPESNLRLDFTMEELLGYFSELAKLH